MVKDSFTGFGFLLRLLFALLLVYLTYNPEGYSYFHWIKVALEQNEAGLLGSNALKFLAGVILLGGWVVYLNATRRALGLFGSALIVALCGGVIWLLVEWNVFAADNVRVITHLAEIVLAMVLSVGMSWSHISRRLSGQIDVDEAED
jgi:hypothetical protein